MKLLFLLFFLSSNIYSSDIEETLNKARKIKLTGKETGFVINDVKAGSIYEKLGFKSKDEITEVNGKNVKNLSDFMKEIQNVKTIKLVRDKKVKVLNLR